MALSPMMRQYLELKEQYPDCIVFYRLGDFYEMFFDDALTASKVLGLTLTGRDCGLEERAPMCGVPHHAINTYLSALVEANFKVAICEQLSEPQKGVVVERGVVRVVTPGTKIDLDMLDDLENNYIAAMTERNGYVSIAWADISTGELNVFTSSEKGELSEAVEKLLQISPSEIITDEKGAALNFFEVSRNILRAPTKYSEWAFSIDNARKKIKSQFLVKTLEPYGIDKNEGAISVVGALLEYIEDTQKRRIINFFGIRLVQNTDYMILDSTTRRNLELLFSNREGKRYGTLYGILNKTKTSMGARLLTKWIEAPLIDERKINNRLSAVNSLKEDFLKREELTSMLSSIYDIERLTSKITFGSANPADLLSLKKSLTPIPYLKNILKSFNELNLNKIGDKLYDFDELYSKLDSAISDSATTQTKDGGYIKEGYSSELDEVRGTMNGGKDLLIALEEREKVATGIRTLKVGYNRVFGYYIEVSKSFQNQVPLSYIRKQTIANGERYITEELKELENKILNASEISFKMEQKLFDEVIEYVKSQAKELFFTAEQIATIDVLNSFAAVAEKNNYSLPKVSKSITEYKIQSGRHPVVEKLIKEEQFVSNDTFLGSERERTMILTGPNMAGKSTYMRQVALIAIMAQMGSFVPAKSAELPIFDRVFTRVGASDNLILDQSTFMVEMVEVSNILNNATKNSLIILDEVGRGTSTLDGMSIAFAVTKYINNKIMAKTLFATHYHELTELEGTLLGVANYRISVQEVGKEIIFLRKIVRGGANRSFGIEVAGLAGLPKEVIKDAKRTLRELEDAEIIKTKKQLSFSDIEINQQEEYSLVERKLLDLDLDDISFKKAHEILGELKKEVKNGKD